MMRHLMLESREQHRIEKLILHRIPYGAGSVAAADRRCGKRSCQRRFIEAFALQGGQWVLTGTHFEEGQVAVPPFDAAPFELSLLWAEGGSPNETGGSSPPA